MGYDARSGMQMGASGAMTGAMVGGPVGAMVGGGIGLAAGGFLGGGDEMSQVPLETPEQKDARNALLGFAKSGTYGNFTAGAEVPLGYGDYNMTGYENQGLSSLQDLLRRGIPDQYRMGDEALKGFLNTDPGAMQAQFDPFKTQTERMMRESDTALKRSAGFAGNLYSTDTVRRLGDVRARGNETMSAELARLTDQALNRRMQAIPLAYQSAESQQNSALQRVSAAMDYGSLTRRLNDASIKARDAELLRRRTELKMPLDALATVAGGNSQFGVPTVQGPSPYQDLLNMVGTVAGQYGTNRYLNSNTRPMPVGGSIMPSGVENLGHGAVSADGSMISSWG